MDPPAAGAVPCPPGFRVQRDLSVGRHPILAAFPGLDRLPPAERLVVDPTERSRLFGETSVELVDQDMWMYVAPWEIPAFARRRGWNPVVSPGQDCIVVGAGHLRESPELILFLDIYHELCHVLQRRAGANLWEPGLSYVERRTEVDAYRFVVDEARALGVADDYLREYLKVEWISAKEHRQLLAAVGVPAAAKAAAARRRKRA
ncbi:MAG TPA: hypothetical protein VMH49_03700 [Thermoplasmata archaeon]|nr:hypothetical protein [Thermoplasmata archaeon]